VFEEFDFNQRIQRWLSETDVDGLIGSRNAHESEDLHDYRPRLRPGVPVLTTLDDGLHDRGEERRMRSEVLTIGRNGGDVRIPNDPSMSHLHAEIRRVVMSSGHHWHLVDLSSKNGTFVRCQTGMLHDQAIMILGKRRFRLRNPLRQHDEAAFSAATRPIDISRLPAAIWPVLEETTDRSPGTQFALKAAEVTIGRTGGGADIELDDPLLAHRHATLKRLRDGSWAVFSETTRNGVWISVAAVPLTRYCFFRCGEQQFRFVIP
jgi:pSer/pThr/pTyr-binding forkhead associated (FHA) protein